MATGTPVNIGSLITSTPGVQGGQPCLAGTRIRVQTIAIRHLQGETPEQLLEEWPYVGLAKIHAALAYYHANKERMDAFIEEERRLGAELAAKYPHGMTRETMRE